eukprot:scaffold2102_cov161-Amphora_coffeaeformis.AAC.4
MGLNSLTTSATTIPCEIFHVRASEPKEHPTRGQVMTAYIFSQAMSMIRIIASGCDFLHRHGVELSSVSCSTQVLMRMEHCLLLGRWIRTISLWKRKSRQPSLFFLAILILIMMDLGGFGKMPMGARQGGNNPPLSGDDLLALGFDLQGRQFIEISIDVSPIGLFSTNSGLVWPNVNSTLRMRSNPWSVNWTRHTLLLDGSESTNGRVSIMWDFVDAGYALLDNLEITGQDYG